MKPTIEQIRVMAQELADAYGQRVKIVSDEGGNIYYVSPFVDPPPEYTFIEFIQPNKGKL